MAFEYPTAANAKYKVKDKYQNFIGGKWVDPKNGEFFDNGSPVTGEIYAKIPRSTKEDIDEAVKAAHKAQVEWAKSRQLNIRNYS